MSQRESALLMDFFEILDGFTKSFDQDFTGQGRTRPFTRPKWNQVLEDFADLSPPGNSCQKIPRNWNSFLNVKKINQDVDIGIWTYNIIFRGHSWLRLKISRLKIG